MSENNINDNQKLFEFAEKINDEIIDLMEQYNKMNQGEQKFILHDSEVLLQQIKLRIDILSPIKELQLKEQQIAAAQQLTQGDFMKNFNLKDLIGALKGNV